MNEMTDNITAAIKATLPSVVSGILSDHLREAAESTKELERVKAKNNRLEEELRAMKDKLEEQTSVEKKIVVATTLSRNIAEREVKLENTMLKHQLEVSEAKAQFCMDVAMGLVRNTEYRRSVTGRQPVIKKYSDGMEYSESFATEESTTEEAV